MIEKLWLVQGRHYSDSSRWEVVLYTSKEQAKEHAIRAKDHTFNGPNPYDPNMQKPNGEVYYVVVEVMLYIHVDQFMEETKIS